MKTIKNTLIFVFAFGIFIYAMQLSQKQEIEDCMRAFPQYTKEQCRIFMRRKV